VTRQDLLGTIGETEQSILSQVGTQISGVETSLLNRIQELQSAGQTADQALNTALGELETQLGVTRQDLLGRLAKLSSLFFSGWHCRFLGVETSLLNRIQELQSAGADGGRGVEHCVINELEPRTSVRPVRTCLGRLGD
jgi:hypothetical protein